MNSETKKAIEKKYGQIKIYPDGFSVKEAIHNGRGRVAPIMQEKPWGAEIWIIYTDRYALKHLIVEEGKRFSLQRHEEKTETWYFTAGEGLVTLGDKKIPVKTGDVIHAPAGTVHRAGATKGRLEFMEVSSPELWDVTRLEDDYGR